jgi:hypothetical protein
MTSRTTPGRCPGPTLSRRRLLQVGALGHLGLNLTALMRAEAAGLARGSRPAHRAQSCILVFYYGGPSHLETWDPKPDAPREIRGEFGTISTSVPGLRVSEHLPLTARVMHRAAIIRSFYHPMRNHNSAAAETLTGRTPPGGDQELLEDDVRSFPCHGSALTCALADPRAVLPYVALPHVMYNVVQLPGQRSGFLGSAYDPLHVAANPNSPDFQVPDLHLPAEMSLARLDHRQNLLGLVDRQARATERLASPRATDPYYQRAFGLLTSPQVRQGFDIAREDPRTRDRYGRNVHGQSVLLARRLVEAGVRFVSVYDGVRNGQDENWDSHADLFRRHRDHLLPPADRALSALIEDLEARGLLDTTLVVALGEFGRTPKINTQGGRDHWPDCFSVFLAGGGVQGGAVHGSSDETGAFPASDPVTPGDLAATIFWRFGLDPASEIRDRTGRPFRLADGEPIRRIFS